MLAFMSTGANSIAIAAIRAKNLGMLTGPYMRSSRGTFNPRVPVGTSQTRKYEPSIIPSLKRAQMPFVLIAKGVRYGMIVLAVMGLLSL